jgi:hypothetical protein
MRTSTRMVVLGRFKGVLDLILAIASVAYGLRRLYGSWTGAAIRVERSSDNAQLDIGFTASGDLDIAALLAFVGSGSGFVTIWYDQSGNNRHATQTTAGSQPRIVNNGVLETRNGKPALRLLSSTLNIAPISFTNGYVGAVAAAASGDDNAPVVLYDPPVGGYNGLMGFSGGSFIRFRVRSPDPHASFQYANPVNTNTLMSYTANTANGVADIRYFINGTQKATDTGAVITLPPVIGIGGSHASQWLRDGTVQEVAVFNTALSTTDRQTLERNQGSYYNITVA